MLVEKKRFHEIMMLALPIIGGMLSQTVLNLVDIKMVGHLGSVAIAAVGICSFINFVAASVFIGLSIGVQAIVARRVGEGKLNSAARPLNAGIAINLLVALPFSILLIFCAPKLLSFMLADPELVKEGTGYLQARFAGIMALGLNFCFRGFYSAIRQTGVYLRTIIIIHLSNMGISYLLIFGIGPFPELGTVGAGLGTTLSLYVGAIIYLIYSSLKSRGYGFGFSMPKSSVVKQVIKISVPASIQQLFFSGGFTVFYWIASKIGTTDVAISNVYINIIMVAILPSIGFGIAASTLVSQALGRKEPHDAHQWGWDVAKVASMAVLIVAIPLIVIPDVILSVFLIDSVLVEQGKNTLRLIGLTMSLDAMGIVFIHALQGAGATHRTMRVSVLAQWAGCLPAAFLVGPVLGYGLTAIWIVQICYRSIQALIFMRMWQQKRWQHISL